MNYEIPNFTARMKVCKDLKLVKKMSNRRIRHFFYVVSGIYVVIGNIWERMKSVGISINIERKIIYEISKIKNL